MGDSQPARAGICGLRKQFRACQYQHKKETKSKNSPHADLVKYLFVIVFQNSLKLLYLPYQSLLYISAPISFSISCSLRLVVIIFLLVVTPANSCKTVSSVSGHNCITPDCPTP